jgi:hypothetical protein
LTLEEGTGTGGFVRAGDSRRGAGDPRIALDTTAVTVDSWVAGAATSLMQDRKGKTAQIRRAVFNHIVKRPAWVRHIMGIDKRLKSLGLEEQPG